MSPPSDELSRVGSWFSVKSSRLSAREGDTADASRCCSRCGFLYLLYLCSTIDDANIYVPRAGPVIHAALNLVLTVCLDVSNKSLDHTRMHNRTSVSGLGLWRCQEPSIIYSRVRGASRYSHEFGKPTWSSHCWLLKSISKSTASLSLRRYSPAITWVVFRLTSDILAEWKMLQFHEVH